MRQLLNAERMRLDLLELVERLPASAKAWTWRMFWEMRLWRHVQWIKKHKKYSSSRAKIFSLKRTAVDALEASITDFWRRYLYTDKAEVRARFPAWGLRYAQRNGAYVNAMMSCIDRLMLCPDLVQQFWDGSSMKQEDICVESIWMMISGERSRKENNHLRWGDKHLAGRVIAVNSNLRVPFVELMVTNPNLTKVVLQDCRFAFGIWLETVQSAPNKDIAKHLFDLLEADCDKWIQINEQ